MSRAVSPLTSVALDCTRCALALAVAAGHWTQPYFQEGWPDLSRFAVAAVGGFFVLSGFTIRWLTPHGEEFAPAAFFVERLSRLWSVALPAVVLTVVLDSISCFANAPFYLTSWGQDISSPVLRIVVNGLFVGELWGRDIELFSNSLFWSLGYEAGFYFLYWIFRSTQGFARYAFTLGGCALVGPNIVLLLVPWLGGVLLHDLCARLRPASEASGGGGGQARATLVAFGAAGMVTTCTLLLVLRDALSRLSRDFDTFIQGAFGRAAALVGGRLIGVRLTPARIEGDLIIGACAFWVLFLSALLMIRALEGTCSISPRLSKVCRRIGDFTFPLYLFHFPLFVLLGALGLHDRHSSAQKGALFLLVCALIFLALPATTSLKWSLRRSLGRAVERLTSSRTARARV